VSASVPKHSQRKRFTDAVTVATFASREKQSEGTGVEKDVVKNEEADSAEGMVPRCSPSTGSWCPRQFVAGQCKPLKKLVLVDSQFLEQLKVDREYKQIQNPADSIARTGLSLNIGKTLNDDTLSDDQKVKRYLQTLNRYYQVTDEVPQLTTAKSNPLTAAAAQTKRKKKKRQTWTPYQNVICRSESTG